MAESGCKKWNTIHTCNYAKCDCSFLSGSCVLEKRKIKSAATPCFSSVYVVVNIERLQRKNRKNYKEKKQEENCMLNVDFFPYSH